MFGTTRFAYAAPLLAVAFIALLPSQAKAASCGTVALPTTCTVTVGSVTYTASGFSLSGVSATGVTAPGPGDIAIEINNPVTTRAEMRFFRVGGGAFTTNSNQSLNFSVNYTMTVAPVGAGTAVLDNSAVFGTLMTASGNGSSQNSWTVGAQPPCVNNVGGTTVVCPLPTGSNSLASIDTVAITGSTDGGASWTETRHLYDSIFTPVPPQLTKAFGAPSVLVGGTTTMTFTITNPNTATAFTVVAFNDVVPTGIGFTGSAITNTCAPSILVFTPPGTLNVVLPSLAAGASCTLVYNVSGNVAGSYTNTTSTITATAGTVALTGAAASAPLRVNPLEAFLIRYAVNLNIGESVINFTNTGASSTDPGLSGGTLAQNGEICANVFAYSPDEQLVSCCSCNVTPNGLNSLSVKADLGTNTLTPIIPTSLVIKVVATQGGAACTAASAASINTAPLQAGLAAWGSTIHALPVTPGTPAGTYGVTETPFLRGTIAPAELTRMAQLCSFIRANGSGFGICKSCKVGGLGASSK